MLPKDITEDLIKRLRNIKGQLGGIEKMLDDGRDPDEIINQFKAVGEALNKSHFLLLDEVFRKGLAIQLADVMNACPGDCQDAEKIEFLKQKFPQLKHSEITAKMTEVKEIDKRIKERKLKSTKE